LERGVPGTGDVWVARPAKYLIEITLELKHVGYILGMPVAPTTAMIFLSAMADLTPFVISS
jgi:hypothetical protein